jgi:hypothetical protein
VSERERDLDRSFRFPVLVAVGVSSCRSTLEEREPESEKVLERERPRLEMID